MVFQYARRRRWLLWLSGALVLSSLASTKAASSFRHALGAASEDHLNRQLSVNNPPMLDFNSSDEERGLLPPSPEALALYDELVGTSKNYKAWMNTLGFPLEKRTDLDEEAFETVIPVLLKKHTIPQLRQLFHDPTGGFWEVTVGGKSLGLRLLQQWEKEGVPDDAIMQRMMQGENNRNMLNDESMLRTWISFSDGRELNLHSFYLMFFAHDFSSHADKDLLQFFFVVSEMSRNPDLKKAASKHTIGMFEIFYTNKWDRESVVKNLDIIGDEVKKMEAVLRRYDDFAASRSADKHVITQIVRVEKENKEEAKKLENSLFEKWSDESWFPTSEMWDLKDEESKVLERLIERLDGGTF